MSDDRDNVLRLMTRYNQIGAQLPAEDDDDFDRDRAKMLLREMRKVQSQIDRLLMSKS